MTARYNHQLFRTWRPRFALDVRPPEIDGRVWKASFQAMIPPGRVLDTFGPAVLPGNGVTGRSVWLFEPNIKQDPTRNGHQSVLVMLADDTVTCKRMGIPNKGFWARQDPAPFAVYLNNSAVEDGSTGRLHWSWIFSEFLSAKLHRSRPKVSEIDHARWALGQLSPAERRRLFQSYDKTI